MTNKKLRPNPFDAVSEEFNKRINEMLKSGGTSIPPEQFFELQKPLNNLKNTYLLEYTGEEMASWWLQDDYQLFGNGLNSEDKADVIIAMYHEGYDIIKLCQMNWSGCDNFHHLVIEFTDAFLMTNANVRSTLLEEDKQWFDGLPDVLTIYRGCAEGREYGLSWTADKSVAEAFARGHRNIRVPYPRLCIATINKYDAYFAFNDREEQEIVWDAEDYDLAGKLTVIEL